MGDRWYRTVDPSQIDAEKRRAVAFLLKHVQADLGITVSVEWVTEDHRGGGLSKMDNFFDRLGKEVGAVDTKSHSPAFESDGPLLGIVRRGSAPIIYLNIDQPLSELLLTAAHECKHVEQRKRNGPTLVWETDRIEANEVDAEHYAQRLLIRLGARAGAGEEYE